MIVVRLLLVVSKRRLVPVILALIVVRLVLEVSKRRLVPVMLEFINKSVLYELVAVVSVARPVKSTAIDRPVKLKLIGVIILTSNPLDPPFKVDVILLPLASLTRD